MAETGGDRGGVDGRGIQPPRAYAIESRPAPSGLAVLALVGELDLAAVPAVREHFAAARAAEVRAVVLDMAHVTFVDSSVLRELLRADSELRGDGAALLVAAVAPPVRRLFELTRALDLLTVVPTVAEALERVAA